jgi:CubicO group peptidase (beta-lactamase class C family)
VRKDRIELVIVRGVRDVERALPVTPDTVFPIGSCTKAFTSMALGIAQDQHRLSLDDPPRRFVPWFHMADPWADAEVTLRDMLSHRTGLKAKADLAATPGVLNNGCGSSPAAAGSGIARSYPRQLSRSSSLLRSPSTRRCRTPSAG